MPHSVSRRMFLGGAVLPMTAVSYSRIVGANDRIQIGQIGCGHRATGHRRMLKLSQQTDPNFDLRSVCDIWSVNAEKAADHAEKLFGKRPKTYKYSEEMLADPELDAVMIATGDHQHAQHPGRGGAGGQGLLLREAHGQHARRRQAGARHGASVSKQVVQMGSQWLSDPYQQRVREMIRERQDSGKIVSIEPELELQRAALAHPEGPQRRGHPRAGHRLEALAAGAPARGPSTRASISSSASSRISPAASRTSGTATARGWYTSTWTRSSRTTPWPTAASSPGTTCARTPTPSSASPPSHEKQVLYSYSTTFGNGYGDHTIIRGTRGTLYSPGGEGSPQWWFTPETSSGWRSNVVFDTQVRATPSRELVTIPGHPEVPPVDQERRPEVSHRRLVPVHAQPGDPNGSIETGFAHAVAVVMATRSYREGKKMYWDRKKS